MKHAHQSCGNSAGVLDSSTVQIDVQRIPHLPCPSNLSPLSRRFAVLSLGGVLTEHRQPSLEVFSEVFEPFGPRTAPQATSKPENVSGKAYGLSAGAFPETLLPEGAVMRSKPQFERSKRDRQGHFPTLRSSGRPITGNVGLSGLTRRDGSEEHSRS